MSKQKKLEAIGNKIRNKTRKTELYIAKQLEKVAEQKLWAVKYDSFKDCCQYEFDITSEQARFYMFLLDVDAELKPLFRKYEIAPDVKVSNTAMRYLCRAAQLDKLEEVIKPFAGEEVELGIAEIQMHVSAVRKRLRGTKLPEKKYAPKAKGLDKNDKKYLLQTVKETKKKLDRQQRRWRPVVNHMRTHLGANVTDDEIANVVLDLVRRRFPSPTTKRKS